MVDDQAPKPGSMSCRADHVLMIMIITKTQKPFKANCMSHQQNMLQQNEQKLHTSCASTWNCSTSCADQQQFISGSKDGAEREEGHESSDMRSARDCARLRELHSTTLETQPALPLSLSLSLSLSESFCSNSFATERSGLWQHGMCMSVGS